MTRGIALALACLSTSCLVLPTTHTEVARVYEQPGPQQWASPATLTAQVEAVVGRSVSVRTYWYGTCTYDRAVVTEKRRWRKARFHLEGCSGGSGCAAYGIIALVLAPVTIPISALITYASIAGDETEVFQEIAHNPTTMPGCAVDAPNIAVTVVGPGQELSATTDAAGRAVVELADAASAQRVTVHLHAPPGGR